MVRRGDRLKKIKIEFPFQFMVREWVKPEGEKK